MPLSAHCEDVKAYRLAVFNGYESLLRQQGHFSFGGRGILGGRGKAYGNIQFNGTKHIYPNLPLNKQFSLF